jgi:hypothetical protein
MAQGAPPNGKRVAPDRPIRSTREVNYSNTGASTCGATSAGSVNLRERPSKIVASPQTVVQVEC